jgi:hypothetical protein
MVEGPGILHFAPRGITRIMRAGSIPSTERAARQPPAIFGNTVGKNPLVGIARYHRKDARDAIIHSSLGNSLDHAQLPLTGLKSKHGS